MRYSERQFSTSVCIHHNSKSCVLSIVPLLDAHVGKKNDEAGHRFLRDSRIDTNVRLRAEEIGIELQSVMP